MAAMTAMLMPVIIGAAGLASDTVQWVLVRRSLQRQADSAALAGAFALTQGRTAASGASVDLAKNQNFALTGTPVIENAPTSGPFAGNADAVRVRLVANSRLPFSGIFMGSGVTIVAEATAGLQQDGDYCILSLDQGTATGITNTGNTLVDAQCGMHANSSGSAAVTGSGSATIYASPVSAVGGINSSSNFAPGTVFTPNNSYQRDPFASLPDPVPTGTVYNNERVQSNRTRTLQPGVYRGGLNIQGTANLTPGVYYIDGRSNGSLDIGAQAVVQCPTCTAGAGVTFVLTNSDFGSGGVNTAAADVRINGGANLNLVAPDSGTFKGILMYQDRRTPAMGDTAHVNGNSSSRLRGALYFPRNELVFNGTSGMNIDCLQMVGFRITFSGTSDIRNICPALSSSGAFKGTIVRLVG